MNLSETAKQYPEVAARAEEEHGMRGEYLDLRVLNALRISAEDGKAFIGMSEVGELVDDAGMALLFSLDRLVEEGLVVLDGKTIETGLLSLAPPVESLSLADVAEQGEVS